MRMSRCILALAMLAIVTAVGYTPATVADSGMSAPTVTQEAAFFPAAVKSEPAPNFNASGVGATLKPATFYAKTSAGKPAAKIAGSGVAGNGASTGGTLNLFEC